MADPFEELREMVEDIFGERLVEFSREEFTQLWRILGEQVIGPGAVGLDILQRDAARFERLVGEATAVLEDLGGDWVRLFTRNGVSQQ